MKEVFQESLDDEKKLHSLQISYAGTDDIILGSERTFRQVPKVH